MLPRREPHGPISNHWAESLGRASITWSDSRQVALTGRRFRLRRIFPATLTCRPRPERLRWLAIRSICPVAARWERILTSLILSAMEQQQPVMKVTLILLRRTTAQQYSGKTVARSMPTKTVLTLLLVRQIRDARRLLLNWARGFRAPTQSSTKQAFRMMPASRLTLVNP